MSARPPRMAHRALTLLIRDEAGLALIDDLEELFLQDIASGTPEATARRRYRKEAAVLAGRWLAHRINSPGRRGPNREPACGRNCVSQRRIPWAPYCGP